ncbi:MAG TPA: DoxX family protein [Kofleriaceae bacterium]|nr:DoxX family protein [Kofleriaceae bacterium]
MISILAFATGIASVAGALPPNGATRLVQQILIYRGWLVVGVALASVLMLAVRRPVVRAFVASPDVLRGLRVSLALSFLITEIAKLAHDSEMRQFFIESGYPVWFLYATITAETLGSIALLSSRRLVAPAAAGLAAIMVGAIYTHRHNGDPFEASLEATHLLAISACTLVLDRYQKAARGYAGRRPTE